MNAGAWHDRGPGEKRIKLDYTGIVTFYDTSLSSLVLSRRNASSRSAHRLLSISKADVESVITELDDVFSRRRSSDGRASKVDWNSIIKVVLERYGERLDGLNYLLNEERFAHNVTRQVSLYRTQLLIMLNPYMVTHAVPKPNSDPRTNTTWVDPIIHYCSTTQTFHIDKRSLTAQEVRTLNAVKKTLSEICRTLGSLWVDAFDVEEMDIGKQGEVLDRSRMKVKDLMLWLDWSMWIRCDPACGPEVKSILYFIPSPPFCVNFFFSFFGCVLTVQHIGDVLYRYVAVLRWYLQRYRTLRSDTLLRPKIRSILFLPFIHIIPEPRAA